VLDFFTISDVTIEKDGKVIIAPQFVVGRSQDLMVRGKSFYAIWDEEAGMWSTDEYDVGRLVDNELRAYAKEHYPDLQAPDITIKTMRNYGSKSWMTYRMFVSNLSDNYHQLDDNLTFANTEVKKTDYVSRRLPYALTPGDHSAWDEIVGTLYSPEERRKIEWSIGSIISGDSKKIQKFFVFYGRPGSGKSTIMDVMERLFPGYSAKFEAKALGSMNGAFATEAFKTNPLVAIQHDADLSGIVDNTLLNSIIAHEEIRMNEKHKPTYTGRVHALLFIGTNLPVKISDAKSGIIRRLVDIHPSGALIPANHYTTLMSRIDFELGAIAEHCLAVYRSLGKNYYNGYRATEMMLQTDIFFNFIEANYEIFKSQDGCSLQQAYALYKEYCSGTGIDKPKPQYKFREELRNYFREFKDRHTIDGQQVRSYYLGFTAEHFKVPTADETAFSLVIEETTSLLDEVLAGQPAQYSKSDGSPEKYWTDDERLIDGVLKKPKPSQVVSTVLSDIDTHREHFVRMPENHIVIDFDLKGENGAKNLDLNLQAASSWPATYAELSKGGEGVHLHYLYDGDVARLAPLFAPGIEVKVFSGLASLRRRLSKCNSIPVSTISGGLPLKEKAKVLDTHAVQSEQGLRSLIARNFHKEFHPGTKPSVDFINKILDDAYSSGLSYDVTDLRPKLVAFANNSTNRAMECLKIVQSMRLSSEAVPPAVPAPRESSEPQRPAFFDVESFPNLFVICWSYEGSDTVVKMINPSQKDVEGLLKLKLIGYNNRYYDNHMVYGAMLGYTVEQLYQLSKKLIDNQPNARFASAYGLSYTDVYDYMSEKTSLKKLQIRHGLTHKELDLPWDEPVPPEKWEDVANYCGNDVMTLKEVHEIYQADFTARQILAELSGLSVNDTTQKHTAHIIFEGDRNPQTEFVYTKLSEEFPGYVYEMGKSTYRGEEVGEGGYVYAEPGIHTDVALLDVASMHPTSIINLNMFGKYTPNFEGLMKARLAIKHRDYDGAAKMLNGKLDPFLRDREDNYDIAKAKQLSYALKIIINIVYGLTSANFDNAFRDKRNKDNIAAKRGALFMIDLKHAVQEQGFQVVHIKTDSIKIANTTQEIIDFVFKFGEKYGYTFEHENTYSKFCLVNDAVYVAKTGPDEKAEWTAVGAQFRVPFVFKTLFSGDPVLRQDLAETKEVKKGAIYLKYDNGHKIFVGRTGRFVPVKESSGVGGTLLRVDGDKEYAVAGTKGYFWLEQEKADLMDADLLQIDMSYFDNLAEKALETIGKFGSYEELIA
jgi:hypothetical protein